VIEPALEIRLENVTATPAATLLPIVLPNVTLLPERTLTTLKNPVPSPNSAVRAEDVDIPAVDPTVITESATV